MLRNGRLPRSAAVAVIASGAIAAQAGAAVDPTIGVRPGHNVSVFHDIDFVATFGHQVDRPLTVEVFRGGHRIARVSGDAVATPEGGGLEVNHGPEGAPVDGDCWNPNTPDIRPFDRVVVTDSAGGQDAILVDDIAYETGPVENAAGDIAFTGHAVTALGDPLAAADLEAEFRNTSRIRGAPGSIVTDAAGNFTATYSPPYPMDRNRDLLDEAGIHDSLLDPAAEHTIGFGHTLPFATGETQLADLGGAPGPALGCEAIGPPAGSNAVTAVDDDVVNLASGSLVIGGTAETGVSEVSLAISDGTTTITRTTTSLAAADGAPALADQGWSLELPRADLDGLAAEGTITVTPTFTGGTATSGSLTIAKDTLAPAAPSAFPAPGEYPAAQSVALSGDAGARIRFTTDGSAPTAASPVFTSQIGVASDLTINAIAVDAAGNQSPVASLGYAIRPPAAAAATGAVPGLGVAGATAGQPATPGAGATSSSTMRVALLRLRSTRMTLRSARRAGIVASFVAPPGAAAVQATLVRIDRRGRRHVIARRRLAAATNRLQVARFTSAAVRRRLVAGRYRVEVRAGESLTRLAPGVSVALRIVR